jgi:hypothetical protein
MAAINRNSLLFPLVLAWAASVDGGSLEQAKVTRIINDVSLVQPGAHAHPARIDDVVQGDTGLRTGIKSRSELLFQDDTMTRIGPESYFRFRSGSREMTLEKGTLLLQVPKGLGGANIHTAAVTASITGTTIMMEYDPQRTLKVLVLEGSLRLSVNGPLGDSLVLTPGRMVIMKPDAKHIPNPVSVDLKKVVQTSRLVNMKGGKKGGKAVAALPSTKLIEKEMAQQGHAKAEKHLAETNLVIPGGGTNVMMATDQYLQALDVQTTAIKVPPVPPSLPPTADVGPSPTIEVHDEGNNPRTEERYGNGGHPVATPLVINTAQDFTQHSGTGDVKIEASDTVTVNNSIKVSDATSNHHDGQISVNSHMTTGPAISVTSSGQLLALLGAAPNNGGKITFQSAGGDIDVNGGTIQADRGQVELRNNGMSGVINLTNAALNGNIVKIGALGSNGTLNVGGGTISADSIIKLYAGGSNGTVNFTDNVSLNGNSVKTIAGDTVTIFNGKIVTINGSAPVDVFTNNANYTGFGGNASTTGTFGGQGANTHPLSQAPGY